MAAGVEREGGMTMAGLIEPLGDITAPKILSRCRDGTGLKKGKNTDLCCKGKVRQDG